MALSEAMRVSLKVPVGGADGQGVAAVLTRQHFEKLATPLFERMRLAVDEACWQVQPLTHTMHIVWPPRVLWAVSSTVACRSETLHCFREHCQTGQ